MTRCYYNYYETDIYPVLVSFAAQPILGSQQLKAALFRVGCRSAAALLQAVSVQSVTKAFT